VSSSRNHALMTGRHLDCQREDGTKLGDIRSRKAVGCIGTFEYGVL
jgi:hypothetical protein